MKSIHTLVDDIYKLMETKQVSDGVDIEEVVDHFAESMKQLMLKEFNPKERDGRKLRLSAIGKPDRQQWYSYRNTEEEPIRAPTYIKFMYGHMLEEFLLCLTRLAGHTVEDEQKVCKVEGIKGHMDARIDGRLIDVKSASSFAFKKFKDATLAFDDSFGYVAQLKAYAHSEGDDKFGWLAMDKQFGHLTYLEYDQTDEQAPVHQIIGYDIVERAKQVKEMVEQPEPPPKCYDPVPDGKSGNMKLATGCSYCQFKKQCWPGVRKFAYSGQVRYLTEVVNEPKVPELFDD